MNRRLTRVPALAALALSAVIAGCDRPDGDTDGTVASDSSREGVAMVRMVNAVPADATLDVFVDDAATFSGVSFGTVTPYHNVTDNLVSFTLRPTASIAADSVEPLAENREMLSDGERYTLVALPAVDGEEPTLRVLEETRDAGEPGRARIRFLNAARGLETFDVYVPTSTDPFFDDVDFGTEAGFKTMDAGTGRIEVRGDDEGPVLFTLPERTYEAGKSYTFILTARGTGAKAFDVVSLESEIPAPATPDRHDDSADMH